jgi:CRP-like cAMP-binding protein
MSAAHALPRPRIPLAQDSNRIAAAAVPNADRGNLVLDRLGDGDWAALQPILERVPLQAGERLAGEMGAAACIYFPVAGLISISASSARGKAIEVALVGREGVAGLEAVLGDSHVAGLESVVHFPGPAWRVSARELQPLVEALPACGPSCWRSSMR